VPFLFGPLLSPLATSEQLGAAPDSAPDQPGAQPGAAPAHSGVTSPLRVGVVQPLFHPPRVISSSFAPSTHPALALAAATAATAATALAAAAAALAVAAALAAAAALAVAAALAAAASAAAAASQHPSRPRRLHSPRLPPPPPPVSGSEDHVVALGYSSSPSPSRFLLLLHFFRNRGI
jgi:hypothetical protein